MITSDQPAIKNSDYEKYFQNGIDYNRYKKQMEEDHASNGDDKIKEYINLNQHRMQRVEKTYNPSPELADLPKNLKRKMLWLILTEHWCGDAAQTLPALHKIAEVSEGRIEMKLLYRDQNPELMDAFLTNGTRSIPKVIQLDEHFNVTGTWGPRPEVAQQLLEQLRSSPATAANYKNELHLWYAKDKLQSFEKEISKLLSKVI